MKARRMLLLENPMPVSCLSLELLEDPPPVPGSVMLSLAPTTCIINKPLTVSLILLAPHAHTITASIIMLAQTTGITNVSVIMLVHQSLCRS